MFDGLVLSGCSRGHQCLEKVVLKKVSKSSGARYGFHKEKAIPVDLSGPVVCMLYLY